MCITSSNTEENDLCFLASMPHRKHCELPLQNTWYRGWQIKLSSSRPVSLTKIIIIIKKCSLHFPTALMSITYDHRICVYVHLSNRNRGKGVWPSYGFTCLWIFNGFDFQSRNHESLTNLSINDQLTTNSNHTNVTEFVNPPKLLALLSSSKKSTIN